VRHPDEQPRATPGAEPTRAESINHVCSRCHTVLFSGYPFTWEGGTRRDHPGGSSINSGEARDFLLGGCASRMSCATCHDPHVEDAPARLQALGTRDGNRVCLGCHATLAADGALAAHTHHRAEGAGSACLGCHMPKKNMALDYGLTRYHRIGSPDDPARVERDRPLECALCHVGASVGSLVEAMERWWGRRYDRAALRRLYGDDLGVDAVRATLERGRPHEQAVAVALLGGTRDEAALDALVGQLANDYPLLRYFARRAIEAIVGRRPPLDMSLGGPELVAQARAWLAAPR
jgi:predicted CXXCH cytochrome family protein